MRMTAGILCIAAAGGSLGMYDYLQPEAVLTAAEKASKTDTAASKKSSLKENTKDAENAKEETVYLITDAGGNITQTIVSGWLKNGSARKEIQDISDLTNIENVKGDETFTQNGDQITWQADGADIYYKGTSTKQVPITQKLTYYLDGREISPEDLAGKSGQVKIRFDYKNNAKTSIKINGHKEEIYVPFTVISGMVLDDSFRNIQVNHGKVISDGSRNIVVGYAMPGLTDNLGVDKDDFDDDFELPEYVEVTADAENFSLDMTASAATSGLLSDTALADSLDLSELDDTIDDLNDAMAQLKDGSGALADGLVTLNGRMQDFSNGAGSLKDGINAYTDGVAQLAGGIEKLSGSSGSLETGVNTLNASAKTISDGIQKLDQTLQAGLSKNEKAAVKKTVDETISSQFQKGSDTYNQIYEAASSNFTSTITGDASVQAVQAGIQAGIQAQGLTSTGVIAALAEYYAANGFTDGSGQTYPPEVCQSVVPGTETTYAAYFANTVLTGGLSSALAGGITSGIASQGAAAAGESVVSACESAAKQAGEAAAVSGAESAKKQIAAAIEAKDAAGGHSLVTGSKALSDGTQQLAGSIPALKNGIQQLLDGAGSLTANSAALKDGVLKLSDGSTLIQEGVVKLNDGAHELSDGITLFDKKAVSQITDAYKGDVKEFTERLKAITQAGQDYGAFSGAAKGMDASSKFIFKTDAVKPADEEN